MIPITKLWMDEQEADAVRRVILSGWVSQGPEVAALEREFGAFVGAPHACAVSNCTVALELALRGVGVGPGDEVITVSHSFIATANSIRNRGAIPVFVDIDPATFNMNPELLERAIGPRTKAIMCVEQMGMPCDLGAIVRIARAHGLAVIEDAACAAGAEILYNGNWERIGRPHGDVACFSFDARKPISTGDGGMLTTANPDLDRKFRLWRQHGMTISDAVRHGAATVTFESYEDVGSNYRMTDMQAAIVRQQLSKLPEIVRRRRRLADRYRALLADIPGLVLPQEPAWARTNWQSFCVRLPEHLPQRDIMQQLLDRGVATRRGIVCAHREPVYQKEPWSCGFGCRGVACSHLQESENAQDHAIMIPLFPHMTDAEQDKVVEAVHEVLVVSLAAAG